VQKSAGKVFASSIFWDQDGILHIDYLPKGRTINAECYSSALVQVKDNLKEKHSRKITKGSCSCPGSLGTCNPEDIGLPGLPISLSTTLFSGSGPVGLLPVPWTEKKIESRHFSSDAGVNAAAEISMDGQPNFFL
jgi:hypothetical protein